jgi:hypothetical protein
MPPYCAWCTKHHDGFISCADSSLRTANAIATARAIVNDAKAQGSDEAIAELRARLTEEDVPGSVPVILTLVLEGTGRELRFVDILTSGRADSIGPVKMNNAGYAEFESSDGVCYTVPGVLYWYSEAM